MWKANFGNLSQILNVESNSDSGRETSEAEIPTRVSIRPITTGLIWSVPDAVHSAWGRFFRPTFRQSCLNPHWKLAEIFMNNSIKTEGREEGVNFWHQAHVHHHQGSQGQSRVLRLSLHFFTEVVHRRLGKVCFNVSNCGRSTWGTFQSSHKRWGLFSRCFFPFVCSSTSIKLNNCNICDPFLGGGEQIFADVVYMTTAPSCGKGWFAEDRSWAHHNWVPTARPKIWLARKHSRAMLQWVSFFFVARRDFCMHETRLKPCGRQLEPLQHDQPCEPQLETESEYT